MTAPPPHRLGSKWVPLLCLPLGFCVYLSSEEWRAKTELTGDPTLLHVLPVLFWFMCTVGSSLLVQSYPNLALLLYTGVVAPVFFVESRIVRSVLTLAGLTHGLRFLRLYSAPESVFEGATWQFRVAFVHFYHSLEDAYDAGERASLREILAYLVNMGKNAGISAAAAYVLVQHLQESAFGDSYYTLLLVKAARMLTAFVAFRFVLQCLDDLYRFPLLMIMGMKIPSTFSDPLESKSLSDFWAKRWNRVIQRLLRDGVYDPLKAYPFAGIATFVASGGLHILPLLTLKNELPGIDTWGSIMAFFVVQAAFIALERAAPSVCSGKLWLITCFFITAPLFFEPMMKAFGV